MHVSAQTSQDSGRIKQWGISDAGLDGRSTSLFTLDVRSHVRGTGLEAQQTQDKTPEALAWGISDVGLDARGIGLVKERS